MLGSAAEGHTVGRTHDQRHLGLAAEHIAGLGHLVQDLIHADADEIRKVHIHHGTGANHRRADTAANDERLGDGAVDDTAGELLAQALELAEHAALTGDILTDDIDLIVFLHFLGHRLQRGLCKRQFTHDSYLLQSA